MCGGGSIAHDGSGNQTPLGGKFTRTCSRGENCGAFQTVGYARSSVAKRRALSAALVLAGFAGSLMRPQPWQLTIAFSTRSPFVGARMCCPACFA